MLGVLDRKDGLKKLLRIWFKQSDWSWRRKERKEGSFHFCYLSKIAKRVEGKKLFVNILPGSRFEPLTSLSTKGSGRKLVFIASPPHPLGQPPISGRIVEPSEVVKTHLSKLLLPIAPRACSSIDGAMQRRVTDWRMSGCRRAPTWKGGGLRGVIYVQSFYVESLYVKPHHLLH